MKIPERESSARFHFHRMRSSFWINDEFLVGIGSVW